MNIRSSTLSQPAENINILWATLMIEECIRGGVTMFCVSPGSRSTPLAIALERVSAQHGNIEVCVATDERAAAFFALGYARATHIPAVLICTSGTALANYLPAVVEASQDAIPMLLLTADRPPELRDNGSNQTINQPYIFGEYTRWRFDCPCPTEEIPPSFVLSTVDYALFRAKHSSAGVVHLNCPFREPLAPTPNVFSPKYTAELRRWLETSEQWTIYPESTMLPNDASLRTVAHLLASAKHPLLCIGRLQTRRERDAVMQCAYMWRVPIVADIASGLRLHDIPNIITYHDQLLLAPHILDAVKPDLVLHIGGTFTSKRLLQWFAAIEPRHYIHIEGTPFRHDPNHQITMRLEGDIATTMNLLSKAANGLNVESDLAVRAYQCSQEVERTLETYLDNALRANAPISEITATMLVSKHIASDTGLFLSNSMPIRDMDMLALTQHESGFIPIGTNRGASGIDGILSTATGFASGLKQPITLMIGDLALIHDANALLLLARNPYPVIVIAINNNGGGIFSFLPIAATPQVSEQAFERFWGTPTNVSFRALADFAGLHYTAPVTTQDFTQAYKQALERASRDAYSTLIEISSNRTANFHEHKALQTQIVSRLEAIV